MALLLAAASCRHTAAVWVDPASTATRVAFGLARDRATGEPVPNVSAFFVRRCGTVHVDWPPDLVWQTKGPAVPASPTRYLYGEAPPGWENALGPLPLERGCYTAGFSAPGYGGVVTFYVTPDGAVVVDPADTTARPRPDTGEQPARRELVVGHARCGFLGHSVLARRAARTPQRGLSERDEG